MHLFEYAEWKRKGTFSDNVVFISFASRPTRHSGLSASSPRSRNRTGPFPSGSEWRLATRSGEPTTVFRFCTNTRWRKVAPVNPIKWELDSICALCSTPVYSNMRGTCLRRAAELTRLVLINWQVQYMPLAWFQTLGKAYGSNWVKLMLMQSKRPLLNCNKSH